MAIRKDITGVRFGRLVALEPSHKNKKGEWFWLCKCDCGEEVIARTSHLNSGSIKSCGCLQRELARARILKDGLSHTRLSSIHYNMMRRCYDESNNQYHNYGGRGITVCEEWKIVSVFREWAEVNGYGEHLTIERIDNNGNYCPENCTWISKEAQANNKQNSLWITYKGETKILKHWADITGINYNTLKDRFNTGWDTEKALTTPALENDVIITYKGKDKTLAEWAKHLGIPYNTLYSRIQTKGWDIERAFTEPVFRTEPIMVTFNGVTKSHIEWAKDLNIRRTTLYSRLTNPNWTIERALTELPRKMKSRCKRQTEGTSL
jgi:hypothetical protein